MVDTIESSNRPLPILEILGAATSNLELGDVVLLLYTTAFVRQYFWIVSNNSIAWVLTALVSLLIWLIHLRTKERIEERTPAQFWIVVAVPLLLIYAARVAFPEVSFDVLDYHLINAERALRGFPFIQADFFPTRFPFNPAPDMVLGLARHILGFRLGTMMNFLAVLWVGTILNRLLRPYITSVWLRCGGVLLLVLAEQMLFIINNYMVDLLALPLLLEATCIALVLGGTRNQTHTTLRVALLLGASVAFKLTNLAFAAPILLVYAFNTVGGPVRPPLIKNSLLLIVAFIAPLLPFTFYIYWQTGNPIFPLYNKIFMSPFWPTTDFVGTRWGPVVDDPRFAHMQWWQVLLWPILAPFKLEHTVTYLGRYMGRLSVGFIAAWFGLALKANSRHVRSLSFIVLLASILWSAISGMLRYGIYLELAGGLVVLYLIANRRFITASSGAGRSLKRCAQVLIVLVLVAQSAIACMYVYQYEWGSRLWITNAGNSSALSENLRAYANDSRFFFRDYSLTQFLSQADKDSLASVQAWIESSALESGVEVQLKSDVPALCIYMPEYLSTPISREKFAESLRLLKARKMFALCHADFFKTSVENITAAGLGIGRITPLVIPYYSQNTRLNMALIEVLPPGEKQNAADFKITEGSGPLPNDAFRAELSLSRQPPKSLGAGLKETVYVKVKNISNFVWPAFGSKDGPYRLLLGNHWLDPNNTMLVNDDGRNILLYDLNPGEEAEVPLTIKAPWTPGNYVLEIDLVQENVTWFGLKGSKVLHANVIVEK